MKPVPVLVESEHEAAFAAVRAAASSLREAEAQSERAAKKADAARGAADMRRLELGKALARARSAFPASGPKARGWGEFLAAEGIEQSTAWRYMQLAGYVEAREVACNSDGVQATPQPVPTYAQAGITKRRDEAPSDEDWDPVPQPPAPLPRSGFDLRLGKWETALATTGMVDVVIADPPFSPRTHASRATRSDGVDASGLAPSFPPWTQADVDAFVGHWSARTRGWLVCLCDDPMIPWYRAAYARAGRVDFAPVPCVIQGMSVRTRGDGPSSWAVYAMVSRPSGSEFAAWGTLPGAYVGPREVGAENGRGKPSWLMRALVRDYSRPGDLVCDPLAGYGSTLLAALDEGRRSLGAEIDHGAYDEAYRRAAGPRETTNPETED